MTSVEPIRVRLLAPATLAALAALAALGCTGSGDGGLGLTQDFLNAGATFDSRTALVPGGTRPYVDLAQSTDTRTTFCLDVVVHRVQDLYSVAFTLAFDPTQVRLRSWAVGDVLGTGLLAEVDDATPGQVVAGVSRQLGVHGMAGVTGEGTVLTLCFDIVGEATNGAVDFIPALALEDPAGAELNVGGTAVWVGGSLTTQLP